MGPNNGDMKESLVVAQSSQGVEIRGSLLRLTRFVAAFEVYNPSLVLAASEVLSEFRVLINDQTIYSGKAVLSNVMHAGTMLVCEAKLEESGFTVASFAPSEVATWVSKGFAEFFGQWQKLYKVDPEFKVVVADM